MSTATIDPRHTHGTDLTGDDYLAALCDLYDAARRVSALAVEGMGAKHKQRRLAAIEAHRAVAEAARAAEAAIDTYMHTFRQPVIFRHKGWRWAIPSQPRGLICTRDGLETMRSELKRGEL